MQFEVVLTLQNRGWYGNHQTKPNEMGTETTTTRKEKYEVGTATNAQKEKCEVGTVTTKVKGKNEVGTATTNAKKDKYQCRKTEV